MKTRNHPSREAARLELASHDFAIGFSSPGRPELWCRSKDRARYAVAREIVDADVLWHIVAYPEPATCLPRELAALTERDRPVLMAGKDDPDADFNWLQ